MSRARHTEDFLARNVMGFLLDKNNHWIDFAEKDPNRVIHVDFHPLGDRADCLQTLAKIAALGPQAGTVLVMYVEELVTALTTMAPELIVERITEGPTTTVMVINGSDTFSLVWSPVAA